MIQRLVICLIVSQMVLSEPDLCENPKLNSITSVIQDFWFFTSGGYYWYIKESDFPPGKPTDKLPDGFNRGDAAFYCDYQSVCANVSTARKDQVIVLVEKTDSGNTIIEFSHHNKSWLSTRGWSSDHMVGRVNIPSPGEEIEAIFSLRPSEVFVVQKDKYAGLDWLSFCSSGWASQFSVRSVNDLQNSMNSFDAITVKDSNLYYFIDDKFWKSPINFGRSKDGYVSISKGQERNTAKEFFKFKDCKQNTPSKSDENPDVTEATDKPENTPKGSLKPQASDNDSQNKDKEEDEGLGTVFLIGIVVAVVVVVLIVIGGVVYLMGGKSKPEEAKNKKAVPAAPPKQKVGPFGKPPKPSKKK